VSLETMQGHRVREVRHESLVAPRGLRNARSNAWDGDMAKAQDADGAEARDGDGRRSKGVPPSTGPEVTSSASTPTGRSLHRRRAINPVLRA
jgi:hypothetical protein